jgi:hypothetical protein
MSLVEVKDANDPQYLDVEDLKTKSVSGLDEIYRKGTAPNVTELEGRYDGVVLAGRMPFMDNTTSVKIANSPLVRWGGKKFDVVSENLAEGTNWFDLGLFEIDAYSFEGRLEPARFGGGDCYVLDYDASGNPPPANRVRDEVKKLRDGLYLGRIYVDTVEDNRFVSYFAITKSFSFD